VRNDRGTLLAFAWNAPALAGCGSGSDFSEKRRAFVSAPHNGAVKILMNRPSRLGLVRRAGINLATKITHPDENPMKTLTLIVQNMGLARERAWSS
jgi:hypothetical protein